MYQLFVCLLQPYTLLLLSLLGILVSVWRRERPRRRKLGIAVGLVVVMCLLSLPAVGHLAEGSLEWSHPPTHESPIRSDTIVVLAGNAHADNEDGTRIRVGDETVVRCLHGFQLYRQAGGCRVIVSGGKIDPSKSSMSVAEAMRDFFVELGARPADLVLEDKSATTFENARNTGRILGASPVDRIFLVTAATHMRRAKGCFARQGIEVVPAPCHHRALRLEFSAINFVPSASGMQRVQRASHEWLGLAWYWLRGRV